MFVHDISNISIPKFSYISRPYRIQFYQMLMCAYNEKSSSHRHEGTVDRFRRPWKCDDIEISDKQSGMRVMKHAKRYKNIGGARFSQSERIWSESFFAFAPKTIYYAGWTRSWTVYQIYIAVASGFVRRSEPDRRWICRKSFSLQLNAGYRLVRRKLTR